MREEKAGVDEVEGARRRLPLNIGAAGLDGEEALSPGFGGGNGELFLVEVDGEDAAAGPDGARHVEGDVTAAAAGVETRHAASQSGAREKRVGAGPHHRGQNA